MTVTAWHPGLNHYVEELPRPFPEITECPGRPIQDGLAEAFEPALHAFNDRLQLGRSVPLIVSASPSTDVLHAVVERPEDITARVGNMEKLGEYRSFAVAMNGVYVAPVSEAARFLFRPEQDRYSFGACAAGLTFLKYEIDTQQDFDGAAEDLTRWFGGFAVGAELSETDLTQEQRENLHMLSVILKGYFLGHRDELSWLTREPNKTQLTNYRDRMAGIIPRLPDAKSQELLPTLYALAGLTAKQAPRQHHRIGEDYRKVRPFS